MKDKENESIQINKIKISQFKSIPTFKVPRLDNYDCLSSQFVASQPVTSKSITQFEPSPESEGKVQIRNFESLMNKNNTNQQYLDIFIHKEKFRPGKKFAMINDYKKEIEMQNFNPYYEILRNKTKSDSTKIIKYW